MDKIEVVSKALDIPIFVSLNDQNFFYPQDLKKWYEEYISIPTSLEETFTGQFDEKYLLINNSLFSICIGPFVLSLEEVHTILKKVNLAYPKFDIMRYQKIIRFYTVERLIMIKKMIITYLDESVQLNDLTGELPNLTKNSPYKIETEQNLFPSHMNYLLEKRFYDAITAGNIEEIETNLDIIMVSPQVSRLADDSMRSLKNLVISSITLVTRASIKGGILPEVAYSLSDNYIYRLETLYDRNNIYDLYTTMILDFTKRVNRARKFSEFIPIVSKTINLINENTSISLSEAAQELGVSSHYLSRQFSKETNMSFTKYKQNVAVKHAIKLMEISNSSITEIALDLGFPNVNYFSKVFKQITGVSPKKYKKN